MSTVKYHLMSQPLESPNSISILSSFRDLLLSSLGPSGGLKLLVTGGGYFVVTSSSSRILNYITLDNPICLFISQIMKSQLKEFKDNGLYIGILASSLLIETLLQNAMPAMVVTSIMQQICLDLSSLLNSIKIPVDFSTVTQLLPIVKTVVQSKPACSLTCAEIDLLVIGIVKAFLNSCTETNIGDVMVMARNNSDLVNSTFPGVLCESGLFQTNDKIMNLFNNQNYKMYSLLLFNIMLSDDKAEKRRETDCIVLSPDIRNVYNVKTAMRVMRLAIELEVNIIACQKVVHPLICLFLRRNNILLLDRMGTQLTEYVEKISGAIPISDLDKCFNKESLIPLLGQVSSVRPLQRGMKNYILLERADRSVSTLLVGGINAEASDELKVTTEQALQSLRQLLAEPYILPGAGCMEMALLAGLAVKVNANGAEYYKCSERQLQTSLLLLQKSLLSAAGFSKRALATLSADTAYYHAWQNTGSEDWSSCRCGLVTAAMVQEARKKWLNLNLNSGVLLSDCEVSRKLLVDTFHNHAIVDLFSCKYNALKLSLECFSGLAGIGMILYKSRE